MRTVSPVFFGFKRRESVANEKSALLVSHTLSLTSDALQGGVPSEERAWDRYEEGIYKKSHLNEKAFANTLTRLDTA